MITIALVVVLVFVSGIMKAQADEIAHEKDNSDWVNKYKIPLEICDKAPWYYLGMKKPIFVEKRPFSSTFLVFLTDKWHRYNFIQYRCVDLSIMLLICEFWALLLLILLPILRGIPMWIWYRKN